MTFGGRVLKISSDGDSDFPGSLVQDCTSSGKRFHYKWNDFFSHVQAVIWVGCALWQSHLPAADALPSHQTHTLLFRRGMDGADGLCSFSSAVDLQSYLQTGLGAATSSAGLDSILWLRIQRQQRYPPSSPPFVSGLLNPINHNHFVIAQHWKHWQVEIVEEFANACKILLRNCMNETRVSHEDPWAKVQFM